MFQTLQEKKNLNESLAGWSSLSCSFFPFITLNISCLSLLACRVSAEKSADSLMSVPFYVMCCFSFAGFNILSLSLNFAMLIRMCLGVVLFGLDPVQDSPCFLYLDVISLPRLGKFSVILFSDMFSAPFSLPSPSGAPVLQILACLMLSQRSLKLSSIFKILFSFF